MCRHRRLPKDLPKTKEKEPCKKQDLAKTKEKETYKKHDNCSIKPKTKKLSKFYHGIAGFCAGFISVLSLYPLDLIKTRLQAHKHGYKTTFQALLMLWKKYGLHGLYHGCGFAVFSSSVSWGLWHFFYSWIKSRFSKKLNKGKNAVVELAGISLSCSFITGIIVQIITNPLWVFKTNIQLNKDPNLYKVFKDIYSKLGFIGFWNGFFISIFGTTKNSILFSLYEPLKKWSQPIGFMSVDVAIATLISKTIASILTYPYQVIRTYLHHEHKSLSIVQTFQIIYQSHGILGLYSGLPTSLIRVLPQSCITFVVYEEVVRYLKCVFGEDTTQASLHDGRADLVTDIEPAGGVKSGKTTTARVLKYDEM